jgi:hypothetical protein
MYTQMTMYAMKNRLNLNNKHIYPQMTVVNEKQAKMAMLAMKTKLNLKDIHIHTDGNVNDEKRLKPQFFIVLKKTKHRRREKLSIC